MPDIVLGLVCLSKKYHQLLKPFPEMRRMDRITEKEAVDFYSTDLPNPDIVDEGFARWKRKRVSVLMQSCTQALQDCFASDVCTVRGLLQLFAILVLASGPLLH